MEKLLLREYSLKFSNLNCKDRQQKFASTRQIVNFQFWKELNMNGKNEQ